MSACPICRRPAEAEYRPFCSKRCADVDLARWLKGAYVVPGEDGEAVEEAVAALQDASADGEEER